MFDEAAQVLTEGLKSIQIPTAYGALVYARTFT